MFIMVDDGESIKGVRRTGAVRDVVFFNWCEYTSEILIERTYKLQTSASHRLLCSKLAGTDSWGGR